MARVRSGVYEVRTVFHAPLSFVFRWCTDYTAGDPALEGDSFTRRVLQRSRRVVVYEDLDTTPEGWAWSRWVVTLAPPDRWHGESMGNYRDWSVDYRLCSLPDGGTELLLKGERRPTLLGERNPSRAELEASLAGNWQKFARALEADHARSRRGQPASRARKAPTRTSR